jgi:hypothetical protein
MLIRFVLTLAAIFAVCEVGGLVIDQQLADQQDHQHNQRVAIACAYNPDECTPATTTAAGPL